MPYPVYEIFVISVTSLVIEFDRRRQLIIVLTESVTEQCIVTDNETLVNEILSKRAFEKDTKGVLFIAADDELDIDEVQRWMQKIYSNNHDLGMALFIPYKDPPRLCQREDGFVRSFWVSPACLRKNIAQGMFTDFIKLAYELLFANLNAAQCRSVDILQVGKKGTQEEFTDDDELDSLKRSLLIIPHKGSLALLKRCLRHLNQALFLPGAINICFDDKGYQKFNADSFGQINDRVTVYANNPGNVGPYCARHYSIINTNKDYIFFQDSDDIPVNTRFAKQIKEMEKRNLDMVGSHELRIDQFERQIAIIRYPLDVSEALKHGSFHPLFHPTALISKDAYIRTGGFSTDLRFGYDSQFLIRSHFFLKSGNIDDFLYLRFKRPNSLTTNPKTTLGSNLRIFLLWRWRTEFKLVKENKLQLQDSSLSVQKHSFDYSMIAVNKTI
jgi:glycosyltransferase involved in cell wall biosynthesis